MRTPTPRAEFASLGEQVRRWRPPIPPRTDRPRSTTKWEADRCKGCNGPIEREPVDERYCSAWCRDSVAACREGR